MGKKQFDVFIAYHGTYEPNSSYCYAVDLADFLISKGLNVFFYPYSKKDSYKTNIFEALKSNTFLLLASNNLHRTEEGKIDHKYHYELSVEIDSFYSSSFLDGDEYKSPLNSKIIFCGQYDENFRKGDESNLHELFKNRTHFELNKDNIQSTYDEVYDWILSRNQNKNAGTSKYLSSRLSNEVENVYSKRTAMISGENFNEKILSAKKIVCIGISNSDLTTKVDEDAVYEFLENGGVCEFYFLDPNGKYTKEREFEERITDNRIQLTTENNLREAINFKNSLPENLKQSYKLFMYDISPRLNLIFIDDCLFLQFYGFISRGMDTPSFCIKRKEERSPIFDYCQKSYQYIKEHSIEVDYEKNSK